VAALYACTRSAVSAGSTADGEEEDDEDDEDDALLATASRKGGIEGSPTGGESGEVSGNTDFPDSASMASLFGAGAAGSARRARLGISVETGAGREAVPAPALTAELWVAVLLLLLPLATEDDEDDDVVICARGAVAGRGRYRDARAALTWLPLAGMWVADPAAGVLWAGVATALAGF
jgi:hypothetical protein